MNRYLIFGFAFAFCSPLFAAEKKGPAGLAVSETGVGPINAKTEFSKTEVQRLLPGLTVSAETSSTEGNEFPVLRVSDSAGRLFTINPSSDQKTVFSVVVESTRVVNTLGPKIGTTYDVVLGTETVSCFPGSEELSGTVLCNAPHSKHVNYLFVGEWDGPDGKVPPDKVMTSWTLDSIVWKP